MTKKDFEVLARHIRNMPLHPQFRDFLRESAACVVADACEEINPRFDRSQFLTAAGVAEGLTRETD